MKNQLFIDANKKGNKTKNLLAWILVVVTLVLLLIVTIIQLEFSFWEGTNIVVPILSTIASITGVSTVWEFFAKYNFARQIVALVGISSNIEESGIFECVSDFKKINWDEEVRNTKNLYIVITHATTWRNQNREILCKFVANGGHIHVSLPNTDNNELMKEYDVRYEYRSGTTKDKVEEAKQDFINIGAEVSIYNKSIQTSYYYMDDHAIMVPFNHLKNKGTVPALKAQKDGVLYEFIKNDIESIFDFKGSNYEK